MQVLFIGDSWKSLDHPRDSSIHLARYATTHLKAKCFWALPSEIYFENGTLSVRLAGEIKGESLKEVSEEPRMLSSFHSVHWRVDPPVEISTLRLWSMLAAAPELSPIAKKPIRFLNPPKALLHWNEKFAPQRFADWAVPTVVSDSPRVWESFFKSRGENIAVIAKPSGDAASRGVQLLPKDWKPALEALLTLQKDFGPWLVLQEFQTDLVSLGETRIFTIGKKIVGSIHKQPNPQHLIMNLDLPEDKRPTLVMREPTKVQTERALHIAKTLTEDGVYLATIDFIGERLLEINVTSPGLLRWLDEHNPHAKHSVAEQYWVGLPQ